MSKGQRKLFFSADHNGVLLLKELISFCAEKGCSIEEFPVDHLDFIDVISQLIESVLKTHNSMGILICGSGLSASIAANRNPKIRAALCRTPEDARLARRQNDANVLCLGSRYTTSFVAKQCIEIFLSEPFKKENHQALVAKLSPLGF